MSGFSRTDSPPPAYALRATAGREGGAHVLYTSSVTRIERSYVRVLIVWIGVLTALYAFQQYFS